MSYETPLSKIMMAAHVVKDLDQRHAEVLERAATAGISEYGVSMDTDGETIKFKWLGIELTCHKRFVAHPRESLILEYPFTFVKGETETHVLSLYLNLDGEWFIDAGCTQRVRGGLRQGSDGMERIAVSVR
jgi:hypothetical protein